MRAVGEQIKGEWKTHIQSGKKSVQNICNVCEAMEVSILCIKRFFLSCVKQKHIYIRLPTKNLLAKAYLIVAINPIHSWHFFRSYVDYMNSTHTHTEANKCSCNSKWVAIQKELFWNQDDKHFSFAVLSSDHILRFVELWLVSFGIFLVSVQKIIFLILDYEIVKRESFIVPETFSIFVEFYDQISYMTYIFINRSTLNGITDTLPY